MITKETLFATRRDATPAQKMDLRLDVEVPAGTQLLAPQDGRSMVDHRQSGRQENAACHVSRPTRKTTEGKTGPKFALHMPVRVKRAQCGLPKGTVGKIHGIRAAPDMRGLGRWQNTPDW